MGRKEAAHHIGQTLGHQFLIVIRPLTGAEGERAQRGGGLCQRQQQRRQRNGRKLSKGLPGQIGFGKRWPAEGDGINRINARAQ